MIVNHHPDEGWKLLCKARESQLVEDIMNFNEWANRYENFKFPPFEKCDKIVTYKDFCDEHWITWFID
jgi:hypothetical protein